MAEQEPEKAAGTPMMRASPFFAISSARLTFVPGVFSISSTAGMESPTLMKAGRVVRKVRLVVVMEARGAARGRARREWRRDILDRATRFLNWGTRS